MVDSPDETADDDNVKSPKTKRHNDGKQQQPSNHTGGGGKNKKKKNKNNQQQQQQQKPNSDRAMSPKSPTTMADAKPDNSQPAANKFDLKAPPKKSSAKSSSKADVLDELPSHLRDKIDKVIENDKKKAEANAKKSSILYRQNVPQTRLGERALEKSSMSKMDTAQASSSSSGPSSVLSSVINSVKKLGAGDGWSSFRYFLVFVCRCSSRLMDFAQVVRSSSSSKV